MNLFRRLLMAVACVFALIAHASVPASVFVTKVHSTDLFDELTYPARVVPKVSTTILADSDGVVSRIHAPLGQAVGRGQKLITLSHTDPVYQYAPLQVTSPVAGVVSSVEVTEGSQVTKGEKLALVTDPRKIEIEVEIPALDLKWVTAGLEGQLRVSGTEASLPVRVRGVSPFVDPATGTATAKLEPEGTAAALALRPGLLGSVSFRTNLRHGFSIPDEAVVYRGNDTFVRLVESGKARQVAVKLGRKQRGIVEILSGLSDGVTLVQRSSRFVADGDPVTVETEGEGAPK